MAVEGSALGGFATQGSVIPMPTFLVEEQAPTHAVSLLNIFIYIFPSSHVGSNLQPEDCIRPHHRHYHNRRVGARRGMSRSLMWLCCKAVAVRHFSPSGEISVKPNVDFVNISQRCSQSSRFLTYFVPSHFCFHKVWYGEATSEG